MIGELKTGYIYFGLEGEFKGFERDNIHFSSNHIAKIGQTFDMEHRYGGLRNQASKRHSDFITLYVIKVEKATKSGLYLLESYLREVLETSSLFSPYLNTDDYFQMISSVGNNTSIKFYQDLFAQNLQKVIDFADNHYNMSPNAPILTLEKADMYNSFHNTMCLLLTKE
jgi:hypothetical protein